MVDRVGASCGVVIFDVPAGVSAFDDAWVGSGPSTGEEPGDEFADRVSPQPSGVALAVASRNYNLTVGCIFHSDRGSQYTSEDLAVFLETRGMWGSMGRTGVSEFKSCPRH